MVPGSAPEAASSASMTSMTGDRPGPGDVATRDRSSAASPKAATRLTIERYTARISTLSPLLSLRS